MKVAIRVDASSLIGSGHLVRCLTLADEFRRVGADVRVVSRQCDVPLADPAYARGFSLIELPTVEHRSDVGDGDYAEWLGVLQEQDAEQTIRSLGPEEVDVLVVDHYGLDATWESRLSDSCGSILAIDDLANREHAADVVVDQNLRPDGAAAYGTLVPKGCRVLSGPSYALIRDEYVRARHPWHSGGRPCRALVTIGGVDDPELIRVILEGLIDLSDQLEAVDLVVAAPNAIGAGLGVTAGVLPLRLHGPQPHLADLMAGADISVGAGGGTTWERLCVGLPSIVTSRAENQRRGTRELGALGAVIDLGGSASLAPVDVRDAVDALLSSNQERRRMHELGHALVDGYGRKRVVESIMPTAASALTLREADPDDRGLFWMWANDRSVREQSLISEYISWETHVAWFERANGDPDVRLLVLEAGDLPVGQLRFDIDAARATVNYSLDACVRGRGWGRRLIEMGMQWLRTEVAGRSLELLAVVRVGNSASCRVFDHLGFVRECLEQDGQTVFRFTRALGP